MIQVLGQVAVSLSNFHLDDFPFSPENLFSIGTKDRWSLFSILNLKETKISKYYLDNVMWGFDIFNQIVLKTMNDNFKFHNLYNLKK